MKTVTLSKNSIFSWYYDLVMGKLPKSLCPYFWTMLIIVPLFPVILSFIGIKRLVKWCGRKITGKPNPQLTQEQIDRTYIRHEKRSKIMEVIGKILFGLMLIWVLGWTFLAFYMGIKTVGWFMFFVYVFAFIGFSVTFFYTLFEIISNDVPEKIWNSNIIQIPTQSVSGWYQRNCPLIIWRDKNEEK